MAIIDLGGKVRSEQTKEEITNLLTKEFANLNEEERKTVLLCLREMDDAAYNDLEESGESSPTRIYDVITNAEYVRKPVDIETFIRDPYFLGKTCDSLYPRLLEDMKELFTGNYRELILSGSIGWGKCLNISSTYVNIYPTGERVLLADLIGKEPLIASLNENNIQPELAAKIWHSGSKECARVTLASGQWLEASLDHPVLTPHGYVQLGKLDKGGLVCVARTAPEPAMPLIISDEETQAVAFYIADGCSLHASRAEYCKGNLVLVERFEEAVSRLPGFNGFGQRIFDRGAWKVRPHGLLPWIRSWGLDEMSRHKRIPSKIFSLPRRQLALFIRTLWADGNVYAGTPRKIEIAMASELLIDDLQAALRRFGVVARKSYAPKASVIGGIKHDAWRLQIADAGTIGLFLSEIGDVLGSEDKCAELRKQIKEIESNTNWDIVPITTEELKKIRESLKVSRGKSVPNQEWSKFGSLAKGSYMSRAKFKRLVEHFGYKGPFAKYAFMDVAWEKVTEVKPIGIHPVADLTVPSTKNVVANGIIVHNTFFASIAACRIIYELSCMRDPQKSFGISSTSDITMVVFSVNEDQAIKVAFENIISKVKESEYFKEHFPFKPKKEEILFPNKIQIAARATTDSAALGLNVFSAFMDECLHGDSLVLLEDGSEVKARELYEKNIPFKVHTFDFKENAPISSEAFIKKSTDQECFELLLDSGECLKASGTHPVAVRRGDKLVFVLMSAIVNGEEVAKYSKADLSIHCTDSNEAQEIHAQHELTNEEERRNDALQGARLGIRGMERELSVARVVSKKALGLFPTYDISVPGKEVFIADGVLVHNTNFMAPMKKKNGISGKAGSTDRAQYLYDQLFRRMKSRFQRHGKLPGMMIVVSSKQTKEDFTAKRINESKDDPTVFVRDYCLSGDTKIPLLDGTVSTIKELAEKYNGSEERFWVYSCDLATSLVVAGKAHHPRLTKKNEKIIKITLDNGESVRATAWHPFLMRSGEYKKAGDLVKGDSIMPLYRASGDRNKVECLGLGLMGLIRKVIKIEDDGTSDVYDLSVEKYENFGLDAGVFVKNSTWDAKPEGTYSSEKFQVLVGNELVPSKILLPEEVEITRSKLQDGMLIIDVPVDFKHDFTANLEGSIMDTAGIATVSISPFIQQRDAIVTCIDLNRHHPFTLEQWTPTESGKFVWPKIARQVDVRDGSKVRKEWQPLFYPGLPRHIHIDPSLNSDSTGFAVGCVTGYKSVVRRDEETKEEYTERAPEIWIDFVLKINPPVGGEIDHGLVRSLVYQLQDHGFFISLVTMDQFNSASSLQTFARKGISAERLSVDKPMDPYETLKTTIYENRMSFYNYEPLLQELRWIQKDNVRNKVDHPHGKSKDLADAITGVTFTLTTMYRGSPVGIIKGVSQLSNPEEEEQRDMVEDDNHIFAFIQG